MDESEKVFNKFRAAMAQNPYKTPPPYTSRYSDWNRGAMAAILGKPCTENSKHFVEGYRYITTNKSA